MHTNVWIRTNRIRTYRMRTNRMCSNYVFTIRICTIIFKCALNEWMFKLLENLSRLKKWSRRKKYKKPSFLIFSQKKEAEKMERKMFGYCSQNEMQQQQNFLLLLKCQDNVELGYSWGPAYVWHANCKYVTHSNFVLSSYISSRTNSWSLAQN